MTFGKYELLEKIGDGSIAEVFKAKSFGAEGFEKLLVVKRITEDFSKTSEFSDKFIQCTENASLLNHANIVQVFDIGKIGNTYFLAMEFVQGQTLAQLMSECRISGRQIPIELAAFIASEISKGLDFAHRKRGRDLRPLNVIHRDLTPYNVLLSFEGEVKITDFGIADAKQAVSSHITGPTINRPLYLSPEQVLGNGLDKRTDIFSLGLMLYEMITLINPLKAVDVDELPQRIEAFDTARIFESRPDDALTPELIELIEKSMEYTPEERYADAGEIYEALIAYIYSSKTRVGAHALSEFLAEVFSEEASVSDFKTIEKEDLQVAFRSSLIPQAARQESDKQPERVREHTGPQVIVKPLSDAKQKTEDTELRDVAILAIHSAAGSYLQDNVEHFQEVVENAGGSIVAADTNDVVIGFGLDLPCGRETEEAMDAAFKLRRIAAIPTAKNDSGLGICVWPAKISFSKQGTVFQDELYFEALSRASEAASYAKNCVVTSIIGRELSSSTYQFDEYPDGFPEENAEPLYQVSVRLFHASEARGRLFGRHNELRAIGNAFTAVANGNGGYLLLSGAPGIGKTRLINEGQWRLLSSGGDVGWFESTCLKWNQEVPFSSIAASFRAFLALEEIEQEHQLVEKVSRLKELGLTTDELATVESLLGIIGENKVERIEHSKLLYSALVHAITSLTNERMVVLIWENAEYMDEASREIVVKLGQQLVTLPAMAIFTYHNASAHPFPESQVHRNIELPPLSRSDATRLAVSRLDTKELSPQLKNEIIKVSEGNPLFLEEYISALKIEAAPDKIPLSLDAILSYRLDHLPENQRRVLEHAAVLGHRFSIKILGHIIPIEFSKLRPIMMELREAGLVTRVSASEFTFSTGLMRESVYNTIPRKKRNDIHRSIAESLQDLFSSKKHIVAGRTAVHYRESGDAKSAVDQLTLAGENARAEKSFDSAFRLFATALKLAEELKGSDPDWLITLCLPLGKLAIQLNLYEQGLEHIQSANVDTDAVKDKSLVLKYLLNTAELHAHCENNLEVDKHMSAALDISRKLYDKELKYQVLSTAGQVYFLLGDMKQAAPSFRKALAFAPKEKNKERRIACLARLSKVEASAGELEKAVTTLSEAEALVDSTTAPITRCKLEQSRGHAYFIAGNNEKAIASHLKALKIAKEFGLEETIIKSASLIGELYLDISDNVKAFTYLTMSNSAAEGVGLDSIVKTNNLLLNYIDASKSDSPSAIDPLKILLEDAQKREALWEQLHLLFYLGKIYVERGNHQMAHKHLSHLLDLGGKVNNRLYHKKAQVLLREIDMLKGISP